MSQYDQKEKRTLFVFIFIFLLLAAGISASGYVSYHNFEQQFRTQAEKQLSSIAQLKVNQLAGWRVERLADAELLHQNQAFASLVQAYFKDPQDASARAQLQNCLESYKIYSEYDRIRLLDADGLTRLSIPQELPPISSVVASRIPQVLQSKQVTLVDFYRRENDSQIRLSLLIPIVYALTGDQVLGVVSISIDPEIFLYPLIKEWPSESATAETLFVRRDGNDVLFLNELRFQPDTAMNLRFPLDQTEILAVKAVLGQTDIVEGKDYRGEQVFGALRAIPDSPWFMVARMDSAEVYALLNTRLWQTFGMIGMAIFVAGTSLIAIWRRQRLLYYRDQAEAEKLARENELQLNEAQIIARMGSYRFDFSTGKWKSSDVLDKVLGIDKNYDRSIESWSALIHADDRHFMTDYFANEVIGNRTRFDHEYRIVRHDDHVVRWVHGLGELEFDAEDKLVFMLGTIQDITGSKRAEEVISKSEEKYRRVIETAFEGIIFLDADTCMTFVNNQMAFMLGYTVEEMLGQKLESFLDENQLRDHQLQMKENAFEMKDVYEQCFKRKDGGKHWTLMSPRAIFDSDGNLEGFFGMITDINERKIAEQQLTEYTGRLEEMVDDRTRELRDAQEQLMRQERLALLGQVAGSIGHELRNPLGVISNAIYFLKMSQPNASEKVKEYLTIIEKEARTSDKIITDLLDFARHRSVDRESVPVADLIHEMFERFPAPLSVTVTLDIPPELPKIFVDPHNLVQILGNLTVNACQAMPKGGQLSIACRQASISSDPLITEPSTAPSTNNWVLMTIKDSGMGIPVENMPKLFEPLFTTKTKGIGLGLAVSRKLIEANGGYIEVESEAGLGSTFTLWLPVAQD